MSGFGFGATSSTSAFGTGTTAGGGFGGTGFGLNTGTQQRPAFTGFGGGTPTQTSGWPSTQAPQQQAFQWGTSGAVAGTAPQNLFGGGLGAMTSSAQSYQQQQQQLEAQQRRFWEHEFELIRDAYTPQTSQMMPGAVQQRTAPYKFPFRLVDTSSGVAREVLLTDHKAVEMKLLSQRAEMEKVAKQITTLHQTVQGLHDQARLAKDRLESCRENSMALTRRFLVVLQRLHVMHNVNRPFDARDKDIRDRLEAMISRLEDAVRTLHDVAGQVEDQEAEMKDHHRHELTCNLEPEDLDLLQQALEKQQQGLDFLTKTLRRDLDGIELLKERLSQGRPTL